MADTIHTVRSQDGTLLHVAVQSGPQPQLRPLMFANALGTTLDMWDAQTSAFADRLLVRFDFRGTGGSSASKAGYSLDCMAGDVIDILDALGLERADIVGSSLGGMVAMRLGAYQPARVGRLVLANTTARLPKGPMWDQRIAQARDEGLERISRATMERWLDARFQREHPQLTEGLIARFATTPVSAYQGCCEILRDADLTEKLADIGAPTLIVAGERDQASPISAAEDLRAAIPGARLSIIPGSGHLSNLERPDEFNAAVRSFLAA